MKWFWSFVAILALAGVAILARGGERASSAAAGRDAERDARTTGGTHPAIDAGNADDPRQATGTGRDGSATERPTTVASLPAEATAPRTTDAAPPPGDPAAAAPPASADPATPAPITNILGIALPGFGQSDAPADDARPIVRDERTPDEITRRIDARTLELDGRFRITGNGRSDDPYRISWELLTSASAAIDAKRDALRPPPWVRLLDGTTIEISGYYSTPVRVPEARNLLLTLNRWDGCCIGLPPTPFDAIDVAMREPLAFKGLHVIRFGTFRGRLVVEPIAAAGFLLGLYRLEDATFETK